MYLTGGQFKGRKIEVPDSVRPTLSKVRQSVFNMLQSFYFDGITFLDMFAGSGIIGLEALSRGYTVDAIEISAKTSLIIKNTYKQLNVKPNLIITDCLKYKTDKLYDIIYMDPPWSNDYKKYLIKGFSLLKTSGVLVVEYDKKNNIDFLNLNNEFSLNFDIIKSKKYGRCLISFLQKNN